MPDNLGRLTAAAAGAAAVLVALLLDHAGVPTWLTFPLLAIVIFLLYRALNSAHAKGEGMPLRPGIAVTEGEVDQIDIGALADPAIIVSAHWQVQAANAAAAQLLGQRIVGGDLRQTLRHPAVLEAVREALAGHSPAYAEVTQLGQQDGAFRVRASTLAGHDRLLLLFDDITQARLTERMRVDFVANASHELRTPLASISGFIETLLGPAAEDESARRRFLDIMSHEAARMSRLIDDLLSLSRIELDKYVRPQTMLDLKPLLQDVGRTLAMRMEADGRALLLEVDEDLPQVVADRDQILQVLHNLVSNSLKYGRPGTPITLSAHVGQQRGERWVRIAVKDEGDGIAPEHLPRLTERFYRVDTGRSRSMGGTGLGLAIVKHIVERHRGLLEIASRPGVGTVISFQLPTQLSLRRAESEAVSQKLNRNVT